MSIASSKCIINLLSFSSLVSFLYVLPRLRSIIQFQKLKMNIYVSNLSFNVQDEDLKDFFKDYGEVSSAKVIMDKFTNQSRGFGFVEMSDDTAAKKAITELDGATVEGRTIKVMEARPKEDRPARSNNGGGFRGNNGGGGGYNKNRF
ncbi:MAG TPA: RNA-binding protein [Candidatus Nitrosocosmicus sp.]